SVRQQAGGQLTNPRPEYATGTVHHQSVAADGSSTYHHQVFDCGQLQSWVVDSAPGPWALVRSGEPFDPFATELAGHAQVEAVQVRVGQELLMLPPLDDTSSARWKELPLIPDATARLKFELTGSPVGPLALEVQYRNGAREVCEIVQDWTELQADAAAYGAPEMHVIMTWRNYLRMRAGHVTALEGIEEGGTVDARWTLLLLLHGLLQEPAYVDIYRDLPVMPEELGWWGEVAPFIAMRDSFDN
ncbi:MAG: hypothetical protein WD029_06590, partial [Microthrixaceae bacterium]